MLMDGTDGLTEIEGALIVGRGRDEGDSLTLIDGPTESQKWPADLQSEELSMSTRR